MNPAEQDAEKLTAKAGRQLAEAVCALLERGLTIGNAHRDYCGMGLCFAHGKYIFDEVHDGRIAPAEENSGTPPAAASRRREFADRGQFVEWLAEQSDESLHPWNHRNQPLTLARLIQVVAQCSKPPRRWDGVTKG